MTLEPIKVLYVISWAGTGLGIGLWLWSWIGVKDPIQKLRFQDSGAVLAFASILVRYLFQERALSAWDWAMVVLAPLFILAALWRLTRTQRPQGPGA